MFHLPEGEGELVAGYHTEYSSMKFAMFYLAEYINMVTVSALATTLFLGGSRRRRPSRCPRRDSRWWPLLSFLIVFIFLFCWSGCAARTTPVPVRPGSSAIGSSTSSQVSIVWILLIATVRRRDSTPAPRLNIVFASSSCSSSGLVSMWDERRPRKALRCAEPPAGDGS